MTSMTRLVRGQMLVMVPVKLMVDSVVFPYTYEYQYLMRIQIYTLYSSVVSKNNSILQVLLPLQI